MHLQRVVVPDFRVLKDVDITFEKDFTPSVFPLGSQNGGGKSTLLQLIFVLLHCSADEEKHEYIRNLLTGFEMKDDENPLASFEIIDGDELIKLNFKVITKKNILDSLNDRDKVTYKVKNEQEHEELKYFLSLNNSKEQAEFYVDSSLLQNGFHQYLASKKLFKVLYNYSQPNKIFIEKQVSPVKLNLLLCHIDGVDDIKEIHSILNKLSSKIFLAAPSTQVYLFLSKDVKKTLLSKLNEPNRGVYRKYLQQAKLDMLNFFTYDFLSPDLLVDSFKKARDKDFREAVKTGGKYGNYYTILHNSLNSLMTNKEITLNNKIDDIAIRLKDGTEINVEDLSHGELKRLTLFLWLRYHTEKDGIILMDEVENALHPDWQYGVVRDLEEWAPSTQFILATHSYELCEGVTPAHVKELSPKLLKKEGANGND